MASSVAQRTSGRRRGRTGSQQAAPVSPELPAADLRLRSLLSGLAQGSPALILLCVYFMFEYLRPQQMYPVIDVIPWGMTTILLCTVASLLTRERVPGFNAVDGLCLLFMGTLVASMFTAYSPAQSLKAWTTAATMALMYFCVRQILGTPQRLLLFTLFFVLVSFKFSQHSARSFAGRGFSFAHWGVSGSGWFHNSGELALQMGVGFCISLCLLLALRPWVENRWRWWLLVALFPGTMLVTVAASSSRGGQLALAVAAVLMLLKPPQLLRKLAALAILLALFAWLIPAEQMERWRNAGEDGTSTARLSYWDSGLRILEDYPWGIGFNNWTQVYGNYHWDTAEVGKLTLSHNSFLDAFVEFGYHGGILFLLLLLTSFAVNLATQRRLRERQDVASAACRAVARGVNFGLLVTCIAGYFMSVLHYPMFWVAFAMTSATRQVSLGLLVPAEPAPADAPGDSRAGDRVRPHQQAAAARAAQPEPAA